MTDPDVAGLKRIVRARDWPGLRAAGKVPPEREKSVPLMEPDLIVNDTLPVEVTATDLVTVVPTGTSPNCKEDVLRLRAGADVLEAFSCNVTVREDPFNDAEMVAICALPTAATFAVNEAFAEPAGTVAMAGSDTALLVLARATAMAFDEVAVNDKVHVAFPETVKVVFAQESDLTSGPLTAAGGGEREIENDFAMPPWVAVITPV